MTGDLAADELDALDTSFALHLRTRDVARAAEALAGVADVVRRAVPDAVVPPRVSPVAPLPEGPVVRIDDLPSDPLTRRRVLEAVDALVVDAGFAAGAARRLEVDGLADLDDAERAAVLRLFPDPAGSGGRLPATWIDLAAEWVFGDQDPETLVRLRVLGVEATVMAKEAAGILHGCARARAWCDVVTGDVASRLRTASISFGIAPHVAVAAGGPRCDDGGLLARFDLLAEVARDQASARTRERVAYACLDFEDTFGELGTGLSGASWPDDGGAPANRVAGRLAHLRVPEAYPFQVLGPGHAERLGTDGLDPLGHDRWALSLGAPLDWLPTSADRDRARRDGWRTLEPLLLSAVDLDEALASASAPATSGGPPGDATTATPVHEDVWGAGLPDLASVVIEPHAHPRRGTRLSVLELAAWLAGEPHSDDPANVSPVLRVYVRELAAGVDDGRRQALRHQAGRLAGTGAYDDRTEHRRSWVLADRLLRRHTSAWLDAAGLSESAERLRRLGSIASDTHLVRGVHVLGGAIDVASRRLEATLALAGDRAGVVEALAWDQWEEVCQRTGFTAAADAVVHGVPGSLTFATDQRVMELSRDPDHRRELERSTRGLGDEVWATALSEVAAAAWRSSWDVVEELVRHDTTFSFRSTLRATLQQHLGGDDVTVDLVLEEVDAAARDTIARLLLVGDDESDHWHKAAAASGRVEGGAAWSRSLQETCDVLGDGLCQEALHAAREQVGEWVGRAPELVSRAVVASVTREACSVAGRGLMARIVADSMAGAPGDDVAGARQAVESLVEELADDATAVIAELVESPARP